MGFFANLLGTMSPSFRIGKKGTTLYQGSGTPTGGQDGDVYIRTGASATIYQKKSGVWDTIGGAKTFVGTFTGNDVLSQFTITHSLGTRDIIVSVRENFGAYRDVMVAVERPDLNSIVLLADDAIPTGLQYTVKITS